eukprot:12028346-Prorocentrum_lima.AAC.1
MEADSQRPSHTFARPQQKHKRAALTVWPVLRGKPCMLAQRPFPSRMNAMCSGTTPATDSS